MQPFVRTIHPRSVLSFAPDNEPLPLTPLNVLIGPNGSGKSNLIEIFELLRAAPIDLAAAIRDGGGIGEWLWKGSGHVRAIVSADLQIPKVGSLRYRLGFGAEDQGLEVHNEAVEEAGGLPDGAEKGSAYYFFASGHPATIMRYVEGKAERRRLTRLDIQQSILSQRKDPDLYPEVTAVGRSFGRILTFREWSFGRYAQLRQPQPADLPNDVLLPDARNLGLILNAIEHSDVWPRLNDAIRRFLPRFNRLSTLVQGGTVQIFLHEDGLRTPIPATRLSDGTIRFIALLAILLRPGLAPLICLEEPELGLHPDALTLIAELLVEASQHTQLVVTTQSDVLVSALSEQAESVVICENVASASRFSRLESDKLQFWMEKYRLGEIWRMGELGGNP
jgi:predicted ATPase